MTTLMTFKTKENKKGKCDAKCYDAKHPGCVCCCGGLNHGVGFIKAFENTFNHFEKMKKDASRLDSVDSKSVKKNNDLFEYFEFMKKQLSLFGKEREKSIIARLKS